MRSKARLQIDQHHQPSMPPKAPPPLTDAQTATVEVLQSTHHLSTARATELTVSPKLGPITAALVGSSDLKAYAWDEGKGKLLAGLIAGSAKIGQEPRGLVAGMIGEGRLVKSDQVAGSSVLPFFSFKGMSC